METADCWSAYWAQMGSGGGCLPGAPPAVEAMLSEVWRDFAARMPEGGRLVDLAAGTGAVLRAVQRSGRDLDLVGIDLARLPDQPADGATIIGETRIEALPFDDASFDGISSQFGFEYADHAAAAGEVARIARTGAHLRFVVHHERSPILIQNRKRREAIEACREIRLIETARRALELRGHRGPLGQVATALEQRFPDQMAVREIPAALREALRSRSVPMIDAIEEGMAREIAIIHELMRVAQDQAEIEALVELLGEAFECEAPKPLTPEDADRPIAWLVSGRRRR